MAQKPSDCLDLAQRIVEPRVMLPRGNLVEVPDEDHALDALLQGVKVLPALRFGKPGADHLEPA
jgi:hypothetical protein